MQRSEITIDLSALTRNAERLLRLLGRTELWAVVKADGYGHGALAAARAVLRAGAGALCVATVAEAAELRAELRDTRIVVLGPVWEEELRAAREARVELTAFALPVPEDIPVHLKLDTGMGRYGLGGLVAPAANVVGIMSHFATADSDPAFARLQLERFLAATAPYGHLCRHIANSAGALRLPEARLDAARCGIALYGLSPFGGDPADDGLEPVLSWRSELAQVKRLEPGESTGYGRRFRAERPTWIGLVPVGYADGFRRDLTASTVLVDGERRRVVGTVSMDSFAVELAERMPSGTPVTLIGDGLTAEEHAGVAGTINYEIVCGIGSAPSRSGRTVLDA